MTDVLFRFDVEAAPEAVLAALFGTTVRWDAESSEQASQTKRRRAALRIPGGQVMVRLKAYAESGKPDPVSV